MSDASRPASGRASARMERLQPWIAGVASVVLHALLLLLAWLTPPIPMSTPQGAASGSRIEVTMIGETPDVVPPPNVPPATRPAPRAQRPPQPDAARGARAASRLQATQVVRAEAPVAPDPGDPSEADVTTPDPTTWPQPAERPASAAADQAPVAVPPPPTQRRARTRGQPPGMLPEDTAPVNAGMARSASSTRSRGRDGASDAPSMEVGGYQVVYDTRSERQLREWRDQGITEIFIPLPGTRQRMVCPLETALRRESSNCRMLDPEDPQMANIGDAREVISFHQVYRRGELVWRGPGAYR
ncbi:type II toxin-antitoxin system RelE/ParE family toxin [Luteimonas deserti]|uniref:Type II toxin-antitoxin system RelE/ParE family toxin n=1 Tax=Luteimonas deserti TaxID=2752306 RepID=A0A7Z0TY23_9GAMM|nr:type II toxin-antitoxin system RelE/ParE family toxin [Luteimonas deserti]NYZ61927.1 type II toxin-antitoxin system RelE/ParE family toxin [Luteimonas deserti]